MICHSWLMSSYRSETVGHRSWTPSRRAFKKEGTWPSCDSGHFLNTHRVEKAQARSGTSPGLTEQ
jgi:hypothetical protein